MDHTIVHFEIPADDPERAARFYRELFGWDVGKWDGTAGGGIEYWTEGNLFAVWQTDPQAGEVGAGAQQEATNAGR